MSVQQNPNGHLVNGRCLLIPGAQKAGTTAVFSLLSQHPEVATPRQKEPQLLSLREPLDVDAIQWYADVLCASPDKLTIDASTSYLASPLAARRIESLIEDPRIVIMIRDPARRAFSAYMELWKRGTDLEQRSFATILDGLERAGGTDIRDSEMRLLQESDANGSVRLAYTATGYHQRELAAPEFAAEFELPEWPFAYFSGSIYSAAVQRFERLFPGAVKIVIFEEFVRDPQSIVNEILSFVGLDEFNAAPAQVARYRTVAPKGRLGKAMQHSTVMQALQRVRVLGPALSRVVQRFFYAQPKLSPADYNRARSLLHAEYEFWYERLPATRSMWV